MIVGFTGTREGLTPEQDAVLDTWANLGEFGGENHHGDCVGADADFHYFALRYGGSVVIHPPTHERLRAFCGPIWDGDEYDIRVLPPKPYLERNRDIVDASDLLIACPREWPFTLDAVPGHWRRKGGTWWTIRYAQRVHKPITIIWANGHVQKLA